MQVCLFLIDESGTHAPLDARALQHAATNVDGLTQLIVHEAIGAQVDPRIARGADTPSCVLQWYFTDLAPLEAACERGGAIQRALQTVCPARLFSQQVMTVRSLKASTETVSQRCTYLVAYEGVATDFNAWLTHYLKHHPPLMLQLPGLRELEVYTRIDCTSGLPFAHSNAMQRNKVVFDDAGSLAGALASPVRDAMRRDFHALPPYTGATPHFAMRSIYGTLAHQHH
ncbi:EthD family reductase [Burkholderia sp. WSM2232]|uniref:EthD family reductase n=1 Tax=Burkholderia sp. WSM2232 TaxID=944436 RepID=UPI00041D28FB|nr:EthD family reductase [Burkholderia sp. WSM2232]